MHRIILTKNTSSKGRGDVVKSCFFIGHKEAGRELLPLIIEAAEHIIQENQAITFYTGGYGSFDHLAGEAIIQLKKKYPDSQLYI